MKYLGILTDKANSHYIPDEKGLSEVLSSQGIEHDLIVWDEVDWSGFKNILIRTPWDYALKNDLFQKKIVEAKQKGVNIIHRPEIVFWNMDKKYLKDLGSKTKVIPTEVINNFSTDLLKPCFTQFGPELVIKPRIGAGGKDTFRVKASDPLDFLNPLKGRDVLIQPFIKGILDAGEYSFIFFNEVFSHAVLKKAMPGEFRVQDDHGGSVYPYQPTELEVIEATKILKEVGLSTIYARVDLVKHHNELTLMELEVIEPELFFRFSQHGMQNFAKALKTALSS